MWINVWFPFIFTYICGSNWVQAAVLLSVHVEILQPLCFLLMIDHRVLKLSVLFTKLHSAHFVRWWLISRWVFFVWPGTRKSCENLWGVRGTRPDPYYTECLCVFKRVIYPAPLKEVEECCVQTAEVSNVNEMGSKWWKRREVMTMSQVDR